MPPRPRWSAIPPTGAPFTSSCQCGCETVPDVRQQPASAARSEDDVGLRALAPEAADPHINGMAYGGAETLAAPGCAALKPAVTRLTLTDFRGYAAARLVVDARPVVLTGPNGAGKTN